MTDQPTLTDPYLFDHDSLTTIADEAAIRQGLLFFKENRVIALDQDQELLWATVDDEANEIPHVIEVGAGGGLLVVLDRVDAADDLVAARLSELVPVALIDPRTLAGLTRLGAASPVAQGETLYDAAEDKTTPQVSRLAALAEERFKAATLLAEQHCPTSALELLLSALLALAADRAGLAAPLAPAEAGGWLYGEALPKGLLPQEEMNLLMRALPLPLPLAQALTLPEPLLAALLDEVRGVHGL